MAIRKPLDQVIDHVINNCASAQEAEDVAAWFATPDGQKMLAQLTDEEFQKLEVGTEALMCDIPSEEIYRIIKRRMFRARIITWSWRAAAVFIPVILAITIGSRLNNRFGGLFGPMEYTQCEVDPAEKSQINFQDGTIAHLNACTHLSYPKRFGWTSRQVTLNGEAYFDVTSNHRWPFIVKFKGGEVRVLGTKFNMKAYDEEDKVIVALDEGVIEFSNSAHNYHLEAAHRLTYDRETQQVTIMADDQTATQSLWRDDMIIFKDATITEVTTYLSRIYGVRFKVMDQKVYTHLFSLSTKKPDINKIISELEYICPVRFVRNSDVIEISSR